MSRISLCLKKVSIELPAEKLPQDGQRIISTIEDSNDPDRRIIFEFGNDSVAFRKKDQSEYQNQPWVRDMNQQYQKVMSTIITLDTSALILPIFFLKEITAVSPPNTIFSRLYELGFWGIGLSIFSWVSLILSILCALLYFYFSANRIILSYGVPVKRLFWIKIKSQDTIRFWLYLTYNFSVVLFFIGIGCFFIFAINAT